MSGRDYLESWTQAPRSEMFERVTLAVDGARLWALEKGDDRYAAYIEDVLLPFLEHELQEAQGAEE